jgi:hypothetical protein
MIIYILFSLALGLEGGMSQLKGEDIVSSSFGPFYGVFCEFSITPNLSYNLAFTSLKAEASSNSMVMDTTGQMFSGVVGEDFQSFQGALSVSWAPLTTSFSPYLSGRLGLNQWKLVDGNGDVVLSLNGNNFEGLSLFLGGGAGLKAEIAGFILAVEGYSDFIFSEDKDWYDGFGGYDDNEWIVNFAFKIGKKF